MWDVETGKCKFVLTEHSHAVSVLAMPGGVVITGSQDKNINVWVNGVKANSFAAHDGTRYARSGVVDIIRQIIPIKDVGFATCSNDETIKMWDSKWTLLQTLKGHNSYVYALAYNTVDGEIVSGSEDNTVKAWRDGAFVDSVPHPGTIWSVQCNNMGDMITACEDKEIRIFTRDPARAAPKPVQEEYSKQCVAKSGRSVLFVNKRVAN